MLFTLLDTTYNISPHAYYPEVNITWYKILVSFIILFHISGLQKPYILFRCHLIEVLYHFLFLMYDINNKQLIAVYCVYLKKSL